MQYITRKRAVGIGMRARFPQVARIVGLSILVAGLAFVAISYYRLRNNKPFRLKSETPELSKEITGIIEGYEQRITKDERLYLLLKASRDITFSDNHHELENVNLSVYPPIGDKPDQISASRAIAEPQNSLITFLGNVKIETKDDLKVNTESLAYNKETGIGQTDAPFTFSRENVSGRAVGAIVEAKIKKLEMKQNVEIVVAPELLTDAKRKPSSPRSRPLTIRSAHGVFEQQSLKLSFSGGVTAEQEHDVMSGDNLYATLNNQKRLEKIELRGNSYLRSMEEGRSAEVHSLDMDFKLDSDQRLERAVANGDTRARTLDADAELQLGGANLLEINFQAQGDRSLLKEIRAEGRSVVDLFAPKSKAGDARAANKRLTADSLKLFWRLNGRDLEKAEAIGNAQLVIEPVVKNANTDRKTLSAPRFDCEFLESGNLARVFTGTGGAKAVIEPMQAAANRGIKILTSQTVAARFVKDTQDIERLDAQGDAKFNENDRNGLAANISYTAVDDTVRLRGGDPTVWDSRARTKASELDSDLRNDVSYGRGKTATTYYSQQQTNGATPFSKAKSPVYIASDRGEFHHDSGLAIYAGNARAWQDDNFVRGDTLTIYVNDRKMNAERRVQSVIYNSRRRNEGGVVLVPVFASADSMFYADTTRTLRYEGNVDIRQGTDRLTSGVADVYLSKESSEVEKTVAQRNVVLTQPNRTGTGDWMQYTAADEVAVLTGNPARVEDAEQGSTEGGRLTVNGRDGRVTADDTRGPESSGRVRSTHKIRKQ